MMGIQQGQKELFNYQVDLDRRVRSDHPLRSIREQIDFTFVRDEVKDCYGYNGNESVDPAVIMKMVFLLFYEDVASERELMRVIPERLDWMWFLGYGLDDEIPNHSVLSKARTRWGAEVFEKLFVRIVGQCVKEGLVRGEKIHMDGSLVDANASNDSIVTGPPELIKALKKACDRETEKLEEREGGYKYYQPKNDRMMSTTDPDAAIMSRLHRDARARYKAHRAVDDAEGVITALETTSGDVDENTKLMDLVSQHEQNTGMTVKTVVADKQYGTADNFRTCHEHGIRSHMGDRLTGQVNRVRRAGIFGPEHFVYDAKTDTYTCPAGEILTRRKHKTTRNAYEYACSMMVCKACGIRNKCTRAAGGMARTIKRHYNQEAIDAARAESHSPAARRDRIRRKWLMEGSFANAANNYGFKRARWRRLANQRIQDYMIAAIQNVEILLRSIDRKQKEAIALVAGAIRAHVLNISVSIRRFLDHAPLWQGVLGTVR
jgi:transposase